MKTLIYDTPVAMETALMANWPRNDLNKKETNNDFNTSKCPNNSPFLTVGENVLQIRSYSCFHNVTNGGLNPLVAMETAMSEPNHHHILIFCPHTQYRTLQQIPYKSVHDFYQNMRKMKVNSFPLLWKQLYRSQIATKI